MADGARLVRIFISSPGDALFERNRLVRIIEQLNGEFQGVARLIPVRWETEFYKAHESFQTQIPEAASCDVVVAIFRSRLGTELPADFRPMPDGARYPSGTAYEVLSAVAAAKQHGFPDVYVFRCPLPPSVRLDDPGRVQIEAQWRCVEDFFSTWFRGQSGQWKAAFHTFSTTDDFENQAEKLLRGWLEERVLHGRSIVWPVELKGSPFCGLAAFGAKHASVFFGRSRDIAKATDRLKDAAEKHCSFLLVLGASGAGKSSLVRAGLVPRLTAAGVVPSVDVWRVAIMRPAEAGSDPFAALARSLFVRSQDLAEYEQGRLQALPELTDGSFKRPAELAPLLAHADDTALRPIIGALDEIATAVRKKDGYEREVGAALLLVIDQLDELFEGQIDDEAKARFATLLNLLARSGRVWIIATLRADLFDRFLSQPTLTRLKEDGAFYDLAAPSFADLAEIVRAPAAAAEVVYETDSTTGERLDERLLKAAERPDLLPLLQFTLNQLFAAREQSGGRTLLTFAAYHALGGLEGAVDKEAEAALGPLTPAERDRLPRLLRELAAPAASAGTGSARASVNIHGVPIAEITKDQATARLVRALVDARILLSSGQGERAVVRLAHASVLDNWQTAKRIVAENADFVRVRAQVEEQRQRWQHAKRSRDLLIGSGLPLAEAESLAQRFPDELPQETATFIKRSGQRARLRQSLIAATAVLFAILFFFAAYKTIEARNERAIALQTLDQWQIAQSVSMADAANVALSSADPTTAVAIALEALPTSAGHPERRYVPQAEAALRGAYRAALANQFVPLWQAVLPEPIQLASLSPDGNMIATAAGASVRLFDRKTNTNRLLPNTGDTVWALRFLINGQLLIATKAALLIYDAGTQSYTVKQAAPENSTVCGWQFNAAAPAGKQIETFFTPSSTPVERLAFIETLQPSELAAAGTNCIPESNGFRGMLDAMQASFMNVGASYIDMIGTSAGDGITGQLMIVIDKLSRLYIQGSAGSTLVPPPNNLHFVAAIPTPDGREIVAAANDGSVELVDVATLKVLATFPGAAAPIAGLGLSADNETLMIAPQTGAANVTARQTNTEFTPLGVTTDPPIANLSVCSMHEAARTISTADGAHRLQLAGGVAKLLESGGSEGIVLGQPNSTALDATFSEDGRHAIVLAEPADTPTQKILLVYDANTGAQVSVRRFAPGGEDQCARVSSDERYAALVSTKGFQIIDFVSEKVIPSEPFASEPYKLLGIAFTPAGDRIVVYGNNGEVGMLDAASGIYIDQTGYPALAGNDPAPFGLDRSAKRVLIKRPDQYYAWTIFPTSDDLVSTARAWVPLCIDPTSRPQFYMPPEPADWCIELAKPPYNTEPWKQWLSAKKQGKTLPMPQVAAPAAPEPSAAPSASPTAAGTPAPPTSPAQ